MKTMKYRMYSGTSTGPKYKSKGWECQDHSEWVEFDGNQFIAIADGHGSGDCFRSEEGAKAAIEAALRQTWAYRICDCPGNTKYEFSETAISNFKYALWQEWRREIKENWDLHCSRQNHVGEGEIRYDSVSEKYKSRYESPDERCREIYLYTAYGTTLMIALSTGKQILILQIGDGTCVVLRQNGEYYCPVPADDDNYMNVVVSLCEDNAHLKIRHAVLDCDDTEEAPVAVFLSSDGVDDCFPIYENEKHLFKLYSVILDNIITYGFEKTEAELTEELLPGLTAKGSKDDISLAYLVSTDMRLLEKALGRSDINYQVDGDNEQ